MKWPFLFLILLLFFASIATGQTIITIDVNENGNALWTMEKQFPLTTQAEINDWEDFIQEGQDLEQKEQDIKEFSDRIAWFIQSAEIYSNRSMAAENLLISYDTAKTLSDNYGIIRFSFIWQNFSRSESGNILIGDAFSEGMILSSDNVLIIKIPDGYDVLSSTPIFDRRDKDRLIWDGTLYRSFGKGEPAVVLERENNGFITWLILILILIAVVILVFLRRKHIPLNEQKNVPIPYPDNIVEFQEPEELVEQILIEAGGQEFQSEIVKLSKLSKSKISTVLTKMKNEGKIVKIRKGKGNIIRLAQKNE